MEFQNLLITTHAMHRKYAMKMIEGTGLTRGQPKVLRYLDKKDGSNQTEIASGCFIETASMTSLLNGMEENGLIERRRMNGNKRTYYIFLTEKGKEMCQIINAAFEEINTKLFSDISLEDKETFIRVFEEVYYQLGMMLEKA
ncbi:MAG: MarR family transcriptional regulator [Clostridiaceae bacterium]|nr:MarR family transcriptional regulator [Clostridiaceae bacterium]